MLGHVLWPLQNHKRRRVIWIFTKCNQVCEYIAIFLFSRNCFCKTSDWLTWKRFDDYQKDTWIKSDDEREKYDQTERPGFVEQK